MSSQLSVCRRLTKDIYFIVGLIDLSAAIFLNNKTQARCTIHDAISAGWIRVDQRKHKQDQSISLIRITETKETRTYVITGVIDPRTDAELTVPEAVSQGILINETARYANPETGEEMGIDSAIECAAIKVHYIQEEEGIDDQVTNENVYVILSVTDVAENEKVTFDEAVQRGLINVRNGEYLNNKSNKKYFVKKAIKKGYISARIIENKEEIEELSKQATIQTFESPQKRKSN